MELLTNEAINDKTSVIMTDADNLLAQCERMEIANAEDMAKAGDLVKLISGQVKKSEDARKSLVSPLNAHVKFINDQFKPVKAQLDSAKKIAQGKMNEFAQWVEKQRKEAEAAERQKQEEIALEAARKAEEEGNDEKAEEVLAEVIEFKQKPAESQKEYGNYATTSTRKTWKLEVLDVTKIPVQYLVNICEGEASIVDADLAILGLNRKMIKEELKKLEAGVEEFNIPGLKIYKALSVQVR